MNNANCGPTELIMLQKWLILKTTSDGGWLKLLSIRKTPFHVLAFPDYFRDRIIISEVDFGILAFYKKHSIGK